MLYEIIECGTRRVGGVDFMDPCMLEVCQITEMCLAGTEQALTQSVMML